MDEEAQLKKRLGELADRAATRGIYVNSEFLTLGEQTILAALPPMTAYTLEGGYPQAERRIAWFGSEALCGYPQEPPLQWLCITPKSLKFAEPLTHRDFLRALMHLGFRREVLGDLLLLDSRGYLCCLDTVAAYITDQLEQVRRTPVTAALCDAPPTQALPQPEPQEAVVASLRLDALVAAVYKLSRSESQALFEKEQIFVNGRTAKSPADEAREGDLISVRGKGRFYYDGVCRETKKGKLRAALRVF